MNELPKNKYCMKTYILYEILLALILIKNQHQTHYTKTENVF